MQYVKTNQTITSRTSVNLTLVKLLNVGGLKKMFCLYTVNLK